MAIKVLIVDDSFVFREVMKRGLQADPLIKVVATAVDPYDARDKIIEFEPDVVTCDIEMPKMNGIEFIRQLLPQHAVPVIVVSAISNTVFDAMNAGAVEFVTKPSGQSKENIHNFIIELTTKVKEASKAKILNTYKASAFIEKNTYEIKHHNIIGIGASTGGTEAICKLLKQLPKEIPGIVIVQHIPPVFSAMFAERLNQQTCFTVKEAENNDLVKNGYVYVAPGDKHIQVKKTNNGYVLKVFAGEKVCGHCPSVDVLFSSLAEQAGDRAMGVILTGMGFDGAKGITSMKRKGAITIGQDEASSVVYGMPKVSYELGGITKQSSLELMGHMMMKYLR